MPGSEADHGALAAPLSIEFMITLVRDESGAIVGPAALVRDVTARFSALEAKVSP
jgi:hypothetical protein